MFKTKDDLDQKKKFKIPSNFADEVLNLELNMEDSPIQFEYIQRLNDYYQLAISYYDSINSNRKEIFIKKLDQLYKKPDVKLAIQLNKDKKSDSKKMESFKTTNFHLTLKQELTNANIQNKNISSLINRKETQLLDVVQLIKKDLDIQESSILQRIQNQKNKKHLCNQEEGIILQQKIQNAKRNSIAMLRLSKIKIEEQMNQVNVRETKQINSNQRISNVARLQEMFQQKKQSTFQTDQKMLDIQKENTKKLMEKFGKVNEEQDHDSSKSDIDESQIKDEYK